MSTSTEQKVSVACTHCGKILKAPSSWIGKSLKCPGCGKTFSAKRSGMPAPAAMVHPSPGVKPQANFVEDRKGTSELKAMMIGLGIAAACIAISLIVYATLGPKIPTRLNFLSVLVGPFVGAGFYLGYRRADAAMGFIIAMLVLGTIVYGRYLAFSHVADDMTSEMTVNELSGPKSVAFQDAFEEQSANLKEYTEDEDPEGEKATADRAKLRRQLIKEIDQMPEASIRQKILEMDAKAIDGYVEEVVFARTINEMGYSTDRAPGYVYDGASRATSEKIAKLKPEEKKKMYLDGREKALREKLPETMAELEIARSGKDPAGGVDPAIVAQKKKLVDAMKVDEMIVQDKVVDAERWQLSIQNLKDTGAKVVTGFSFLSWGSIVATMASFGLAYTAATGGKFKD